MAHLNLNFGNYECAMRIDELRTKLVFWQEAIQSKCSLIMLELLRLLSKTISKIGEAVGYV